jgi:hypothetical protein
MTKCAWIAHFHVCHFNHIQGGVLILWRQDRIMGAFEELIFSLLLERQAELLTLADLEFPVQGELAVVAALLRLILAGHDPISPEFQQDRGPTALQ